MTTIVLADCNAFRDISPGVADFVFARHRTGAVLMSVAEASNYDMTLVIEQRGAESEDDVKRLMDEIVRGGKPAAAWLDPRKPLPLAAQAQRMMYEAHRTKGRMRQKLARRALKLWPDCADAYLFLAEDEESAAAIALLQEGLAAGERAIKSEYEAEAVERVLRQAALSEPLRDDKPLDEDEAEAVEEEHGIGFWSDTVTRPYLRVRAELAATLWGNGQSDEALGHLRALLRLCPRDYQGNRYLFAGYLMQSLGRFSVLPDKSRKLADLLNIDTVLDEADALAELDALLVRYDMDKSAHWQYTRAWWLFKSGDRTRANEALQEAFDANRFFPAMMTGLEKPEPEIDLEKLVPGSPDEAMDYFLLALTVWVDEQVTPWLMENLTQSLTRYAAAEGLDLFAPPDDDEEDEESPLPPLLQRPLPGRKRPKT